MCLCVCVSGVNPESHIAFSCSASSVSCTWQSSFTFVFLTWPWHFWGCPSIWVYLIVSSVCLARTRCTDVVLSASHREAGSLQCPFVLCRWHALWSLGFGGPGGVCRAFPLQCSAGEASRPGNVPFLIKRTPTSVGRRRWLPTSIIPFVSFCSWDLALGNPYSCLPAYWPSYRAKWTFWQVKSVHR